MVRHAIIMAGGEGQRLRPLTEMRPKPLIPLLDEPVIGMTLRLLRRHGVNEATLTLCYRADDIRQALGDGSAYGVKLHYTVEESPRGTAGSVKDAAKHIHETVLVLSGDGLTDVDLSALFLQHVASGAPVSMVVKQVENPSEYGVCEMDERSFLTLFVEKPDDVEKKCYINTGIYFLEPAILDRIPDQGTYDFGRELFPALLEDNVKICCLKTDAYWCDIGSRAAYAQAQRDLLCGKVGMPVKGQRFGNAIIGHGCSLAKDVRFAGRCYIGDHVCIGKGTVLGAGTVIHSGAVVGPSTRLEHACLWGNACIDGDSILKGVVVMPHAGNTKLQRIVPYIQ